MQYLTGELQMKIWYKMNKSNIIARISGTFFWNSILLYCVKALKSQHEIYRKDCLSYLFCECHTQVYFKASQWQSCTEHMNAAYQYTPNISVLLIFTGNIRKKKTFNCA